MCIIMTYIYDCVIRITALYICVYSIYHWQPKYKDGVAIIMVLYRKT